METTLKDPEISDNGYLGYVAKYFPDEVIKTAYIPHNRLIPILHKNTSDE